jgi:hypothetical protein
MQSKDIYIQGCIYTIYISNTEGYIYIYKSYHIYNVCNIYIDKYIYNTVQYSTVQYIYKAAIYTLHIQYV